MELAMCKEDTVPTERELATSMVAPVEDAEKDATPEQTLELSILTIAGGYYNVVASSAWSVRGVKDAITGITKLAAHQQRLLLGSSVLSDSDVLGEILPSGQTQHELLLVVCNDEHKADIITSMLLGRSQLRSVDRRYHEDQDVVQAAVRHDGMQLQYAHGIPRKDRSIILTAVAQNGFALSFAPNEYRAEWDVVRMAVKSNAFAMTLAHESLQTDREFAIQAVRSNVFVRDYLDRSILEDPKFIEAFPDAPRPKPKPKEAIVINVDETRELTAAAKPNKNKSWCPIRCPFSRPLSWCSMPSRKELNHGLL